MSINATTRSQPWRSPLAQKIAEAFKLDPSPTVEAPRRKAPVLRSVDLKPGVLDRIDAWFWRQEQKDLEAWLAQSGDVVELERRIRDIGHGAGMRFW